MERERKFLVAQRPSGLSKRPHTRIRQGYLAAANLRSKSPVEVRVRDEGNRHLLTIKGGRGRSRSEIEVPIRSHAFRSLWSLTEGKRIEKMRYRIPLGKLTMELDVYHGRL